MAARSTTAASSVTSDRAAPITLLVDGTGVGLHCRCVLFDMDGVLVESNAVIHRQLTSWAHAHGLDANHVIKTAHGLTSAELIRAVAPWLDITSEAQAMDQNEICDLRGIRAGIGAREVTEALPRGSWAVVTSADRRVAQARLAAVRITTPRVLVSARDVERGKPDPEGYLLAARRMHVPTSDCVAIEDAPAGIAAARAAGCQVIAVRDTADATCAGSELVVSSLAAVTVLPRGHVR